MSLSETSIRRPVFAWMLMIALIVFGGISFTRLGVSQFPDIDLPTVSVTLSLPGAAPEVMEADVVDVVESALIQVEGLTSMSSTCRESRATIRLEFSLDRDIDTAVQNVQTRIAQVQRRLPRDLDPVIVSKQNPEDQPILWLSVYGTRNPAVISDYVRNTLKDQLQTIDGVGDITLGGFRERNVRIWLDSRRLEAYRLTVEDVMSALTREHIELPAGRLETASRELNIRTQGEAVSLGEFRKLVLVEKDGARVTLQDVALVEDGFEDKRRISRVNGLPAIGMGIRKLRGANAVKVGQAVRAKLAEASKSLPEGVNLTISFDSTGFVEDAILDIQVALVLAVLLTGLVCFVFLGSLGATFNVLLAIPTSLVGTLAVMYFLGFTLNTFTLLALSLAVGIVVDDAIMVMENIYRHGEMGKDRVRAAIDGSREITFAAVVATLAIMAIFLPIAFMQGLIGKFLYQFGVVLSVAVALSLLEALTITPARCAQMLAVGERAGWLTRAMERAFNLLAAIYGFLLRPAVKLRYLVIAGAVGLFVWSLPQLGRLAARWELVPAQDQSRFMLRMRAPTGSSIEYTDDKVRLVEEFLIGRPEVERFFVAIGGFGGGEVDTAMSFVTLHPPRERKMTQREFMGLCRQTLNGIPGIVAFPLDPSTNLPGVGGRGTAQINFYLQGQDWVRLTGLARQMMEKMKASGAFVDVDSDYQLGAPEVRVRPDRKKAADLGISMEAIGRSINALVGGLQIVKFNEQGRRNDVRVRLLAEQRLRPDDIKKLYVRTRAGELISLADVVDVAVEPSLLSITRENRQRAITLFCNPGPGLSPTEAVEQARRLAAEVLPPGYSFHLTGASQAARHTLQALWFALGLGIAIAYMILAAQFNSFLHPITVLVALPFSLTGAILALSWTGNTLNMFSMIGLVLLMGIVKKNSILLVDYTNQRREEGLTVKEALLKASPTRLRPILMTTVSTIAAAIPAAVSLDLARFGLGPGGGLELREPMAIAVIGGLLLSTLLTLFVVPAVYAMFEDAKRLLGFRDAVSTTIEPQAR